MSLFAYGPCVMFFSLQRKLSTVSCSGKLMIPQRSAVMMTISCPSKTKTWMARDPTRRGQATGSRLDTSDRDRERGHIKKLVPARESRGPSSREMG